MTLFSTRDVQARCAALGFPPGPIDGILGPRTAKARAAALASLNGARNADLFHASGLHRIHWHWTAGAEGVIALERRHYPFVIDAEGRVHEGDHAPEANAGDLAPGRYSAHTLNANRGAIGVAIDAMAGAREVPFRRGSEPLTWVQVQAMLRLTASLSQRYWIPVSPFSTLSHAEVQPTLGIRQEWKWDITWLPDMAAPGEARAVGDRLRAMTRELLEAEASERGDERCTPAPEPELGAAA